jgi:uncharacterized alkaline shock family protein YloU
VTGDLEVIALIGPSGSGKSHRASLVAHEVGASLILDDGLLIEDGKILAGSSAKREPTRMAAVRRAIFQDPEAVRAVRAALAGRRGRLLLLATSQRMAETIRTALGLPPVARWIAIEEVASPEEIERARRVRLEQGKHVIPAPTVEVKRTFSGYLVDPLRFILPGRHARERVIEKSVVRPTWSYLGRFTVEDTALMDIAARTAAKVPGIARVGRVAVASTPEGVMLELPVDLSWEGAEGDLTGAMRTCQRAVRAMVEHMTGLNVLRVDIRARRLLIGPAPHPGPPPGPAPRPGPSR